jgi:hypothetical protein
MKTFAPTFEDALKHATGIELTSRRVGEFFDMRIIIHGSDFKHVSEMLRLTCTQALETARMLNLVGQSKGIPVDVVLSNGRTIVNGSGSVSN